MTTECNVCGTITSQENARFCMSCGTPFEKDVEVSRIKVTPGEDQRLIAWLSGVIKAFGQVVAVSDVSFAIPQHSIMGFLGPNGAGKTTSIRLLLGLIKPQTGQVRVFGQNPFYVTSDHQHLGYIPEGDAFPHWVKAREYLTMLGRYNLPKEVAKKRVWEVLEEVELTEVANKRIKQFSKGMKQRMKIGQALIHKPKLVIGDEPFNGLDPLIRKNMFSLIESYRQEYSMTFFLSSHILFEVERLANQIVLLFRGRTIAQGSPKRIRDMLAEQPHSIQITTKAIKQLSNLLITHGDEELISSIEFQRDSRTDESQIIILTREPLEFYHLLTDLVVDHEILIHELKATDEGLENLFKTLTMG
ncbi:MAG: ABC transporter ATP-binding protein [Promethearchaeota archaeon]